MRYLFKRILVAVTTAVLVTLGGCAGMQAPTPQALASVPVIEFGNPVPPGSDFILFFPAGKPIPMIATIEGSALGRSTESTLNIFLKTDIYAYKQWVSLDRQVWRRGSDVIGVHVDVRIPGPDHPQPGKMTLKVDLTR